MAIFTPKKALLHGLNAVSDEMDVLSLNDGLRKLPAHICGFPTIAKNPSKWPYSPLKRP